MKTSAAGLFAIEAREGKRFVAYLDTQNVATIGVGHTGRMSPPAVHLGMTITQEQCDAFLAADLAPVEKAINAIGAKLTQNQFDACASLAFNIGVPRFTKSTVARLLRVGDHTGAAEAMLLWDKPAILKARREAERRQFLTPDKHPAPVSVSKELGSSSDQAVVSAEVSSRSAAKTSSKELTSLSAPAKDAAKPAPAPAAAVQAPSPAAAKDQPMLNLTSLQSILSLAMAGYGVAKDIASAAPQLAADAQVLKKDGDAIGASLKKAYADVTSGHVKDTPDDIAKVLAAFGSGVQHVKDDIPHVATLAASASKLPSAAGIGSVIKALGKAA